MIEKEFEKRLGEILSKSQAVEKVFIAGGNEFYSVYTVINRAKKNSREKIYKLELKVMKEFDFAIDFYILDRDGRELSEVATFNNKFYRCIYNRNGDLEAC